MCGIVGAFGPSVQSLKAHSSLAVGSLSHRGPDGEGVWFSQDGNCFLGHRRLAILDSSPLASQPMIDEDTALSYNGEIYNHLFLREEYLSGKSITFKTHSDTETLFYLLKTHSQSNILQHLNGMFAGAYYDAVGKTLLLFRDSLGIKPLYWHPLEDGTILFSSEIKGIFSLLPTHERQVDISILETYLTFENWPQGKNLFAGVHSLLPGEALLLCMEANKSVVRNSTLWNLPHHRPNNKSVLIQKNEPFKSYEECVQQVRQDIEKTVKNHLLSDVPIGAYLSGGLDSGTVVAIASQYQKNLLTFTGYFDIKDNWYDERSVAQKTAEHLKVQQIEVPITPTDFIQHFDELISILEEPRMGMGSFSQMIVAKKASQYRRVILTGHGGDELFCGYPLFKAYLALQSFPHYSFLKILASLNQKEWPWFLNVLFEKLQGKIYFAPRLWTKFPFEKTFQKQLNSNFDMFSAPNLKKALPALEAYYIDTYLPGLLLVEDKISMAFSMETRTPFLSSTFLNCIQPIATDVKLSQGRLKGLFKDAVSGWLPKEVLNAPKRGFPTPLRHWFRKELREDVERRLLKEGDILDTLISKEYRRKLLQSHFNNKLPFALDERRAHMIWMLLCLESWGRQFHIQWDFP